MNIYDLMETAFALRDQDALAGAVATAREAYELAFATLNFSALESILALLCDLYISQDRVSEAETFYVRYVSLAEEKYGSGHFSTIPALKKCADYYLECGNELLAKFYFKRVVSICEEAGPERRVDLARATRDLALCYLEQDGGLAKAEPLYLRYVRLYEEALGPDHPDLAECLVDIGNFYCSCGDFTKAETCLDRAIAIYSRSLHLPKSHYDWRSVPDSHAFEVAICLEAYEIMCRRSGRIVEAKATRAIVDFL